MTFIKLFGLSWIAIVAISIAYVFPPLRVAFINYILASLYLSLIVSAPLLLLSFGAMLLKRRKWH